jgi:hypothetical protein
MVTFDEIDSCGFSFKKIAPGDCLNNYFRHITGIVNFDQPKIVTHFILKVTKDL